MVTEHGDPEASDIAVVPQDDVVRALRGVRAVNGMIAAASAEALEQVTPPQLRALVLLRALGSLPAGVLAERLRITSSAGTRLTSRLVAGRWIRRSTALGDRRQILLALTARGTALVDETRERREAAIRHVLAGMGPADRAQTVEVLERIARATGEPVPEEGPELDLARFGPVS